MGTSQCDIAVDFPDGTHQVILQRDEPFTYVENDEGKFVCYDDGTALMLPRESFVVVLPTFRDESD